MPDGMPSIAFALTPSDTVPQREPYDAIYVGGTGNIAVKNPDASIATLTAIPVGSIIPIAPSIIMSTGTTATNLVALKKSS